MEKKISTLIENIKNSESRDLVYYWEEEKSFPEFVDNFKGLKLDPRIVKVLNSSGIKQLYVHQYDSIKKILNGQNLMLNAGTGSGKTEAFIIPIISECLKNNDKCFAILIYPTKALALDQMDRMYQLTKELGIKIAKYDGDTPYDQRNDILNNPPNILITNPDMLHRNIQDKNLQKILSTIRFVVFDEIHNYSGVFGSSVHYIIKRLKRFMENPQFICLSATIGNPKKFAENLFGENFELVESKKILRRKRKHLMIKPNHSKYSEAVYLTRALSEKIGIKTLIFCESHLSCELLKKIADFRNIRLGIHRAGINIKHRSKVEQMLKNSKYNAVVCTPTLELGIDIGDLGAIINLSIPPTFSRYLQRVGRSGRRNEESIDILLIGEDPISNYYMHHPSEYYGSSPEPVYIDPENPDVIKKQLISMCIDSPLVPHDLLSLNEKEKEIMRELLREGYIQIQDKLYIVATDKGEKLFYTINLRGSGDEVLIKCNGKIIGKREKQLAIRELYENAIYMAGGHDYIVEKYDIDNDVAYVKELFKRRKYYTKALYNSTISNFKLINNKIVKGIIVNYGEGEINEKVDGYIIKDLVENKTLQKKELSVPLTYSYKTKMLYINLPFNSKYNISDRIKASHTIEHLFIHAGISLTGAKITEFGGISYPNGSIFIYDYMPGGSGLARLLFARFDKILMRSFEILKNCHCERDGCPNCVFSPFCGSNNEFLSKSIAINVLSDILYNNNDKLNLIFSKTPIK